MTTNAPNESLKKADFKQSASTSPKLYLNFYIYNSVLGQTYAVTGIVVSLIDLKPPITSVS